MTDFSDTIPNYGVEAFKLSAAQLRERRDAVRALSAEDRSRYTAEVGRLFIEKRHAPYRARRVAEGKAPTKTAERGRQSPYIDDPDEDRFWCNEVIRLGIPHNDDRRALRRAARRLADTSAAEMSRRVESHPDRSPAPVGDDDVLEAFYRAEIVRWGKRVAHDLALARQHEGYIHDAEFNLADVLQRKRNR